MNQFVIVSNLPSHFYIFDSFVSLQNFLHPLSVFSLLVFSIACLIYH